MNIPETKIWFGKREAIQLENIKNAYKDAPASKVFAIGMMAKEMVKRAKQSKSQVESVVEFLWEVI
jgi:hypothetical protein